MKYNEYNIEKLVIGTTNGSRQIDTLRKEAVDKVIKFIKKTIQNERLEYLYAFYGDQERYYITVYAEKDCSSILIHDNLLEKSYNYLNEKYKNDETEVEISGYYFDKMCICEDKDILVDIIINFFETGKINQKYEWIETND